MLEIIILLGLLNAAALICLDKWHVLDEYQAHLGHIKWLPAADCFFCLGFWMAAFQLGLGVLFFVIEPSRHLILIPFCSTVISTFLSHAILDIKR